MRAAAHALPRLLGLGGLLFSCAHAPPPPAASARWPSGDEAARARWVRSLPGPARARGSFWSRVGSAILGVAPEEAGGAGELVRPFGLAATGDDIAVADPDAPGVFLLSSEGEITPIRCRELAWESPMAVAAAAAGVLWVADPGLGFLVRVEPPDRCQAIGRGALRRPVGVAVSGTRVYAVDADAHAVVAFEQTGAECLRFGGRGDGGAALNYPVSVAVAGDGTIYVVDALNFRVARFDESGHLLEALGDAVDGAGGLLRPKAALPLDDGRVAVSDGERDAVVLFDRQGAFQFALGSSGHGATDLAMPAGLAARGSLLFVADGLNRRIQVFELLGQGK